MGRLHWRRELLRGAWDARVEGGEGIVLEIDMYFLYKVQMLITAGLLRRHRATARLATMLNQHLATYQYAWRPRHDLATMSSTGPQQSTVLDNHTQLGAPGTTFEMIAPSVKFHSAAEACVAKAAPV